MSVAMRFYVPAEISALRIWLPVAAATNVLILVGEALRSDLRALGLTAGGAVVLIVIRYLLPDAVAAWKRIACLGLACFVLLLGSLSYFSSERSLYDLWSRAWLIVPSGTVAYWMMITTVAEWSRGDADNDSAERGLARNKLLSPRLDSIGLHTSLLHAVALIALPVVWILDVAVSPGNILGGEIADAFSLQHFINILGGETFWIWARNSVIVASGTTIMGLVLAIPAGYAFSRYRFSGRKESMFLFMLVQMFPGVIILVPYFMVMKSLGLLNTSIGLIIVYSVTALPLCVWMLKGFFDTVPAALEEAAVLDGCSQWDIFLRIILPLSLPAVVITALFSFLAAWNEFLLALVFNTSNDSFTLPVGLAAMIPDSGQLWGDFAAASVLVSLPVVVLFIFFQKALIQGLSAGGVKG